MNYHGRIAEQKEYSLLLVNISGSQTKIKSESL